MRVAVEIDCDPAARANEVGRALAEHLGSPASDRHYLWSPRLGRTLDPAEGLGSAGLIHGDRIVLTTDARPSRRAPDLAGPFELVVCGGLAAGTRFVLEPGDYLVGRSPDAAITVDDPLLSREHFWLRLGENGTASVVDAGSLNRTSVNDTPISSEMLVTPGDLIAAGRSAFTLDLPRPAEPRVAVGSNGVVPFNRVPRLAERTGTVELKAPVPPDENRRRRFLLATSLAPLAAGAVLYYMTKSPYTLVLVALAPIMAVLSFFEDRLGARGEHRRRAARFDTELEEFETELERAVDAERAGLRRRLPDPSEVVAWIRAWGEGSLGRDIRSDPNQTLAEVLARYSPAIEPGACSIPSKVPDVCASGI